MSEKSNEGGESRDHSIWFKVDNITPEEARELLNETVKNKDEIAPEGRGTFARGETRELSDNIKNRLQSGEKNEKD